MEKISWTDRVRNDVLHRAKEERNVGKLHENFDVEYIYGFV